MSEQILPMTIQVVSVADITDESFIRRLAAAVALELKTQSESESTEPLKDKEVAKPQTSNYPTIKPLRGDVFFDESGDVKVLSYVEGWVTAKRKDCSAFVCHVLEFEKRFTYRCDKYGKEMSDDGSKPGFIYLVKANDLYKIGRTKNPHLRIPEIRTANPFAECLHLISCQCMFMSEKRLHDKYSDKRRGGEWFELSDKDVAYLLGIEKL